MLNVLVWNKYSRIIGLIAERLNISTDKALSLFYHSPVYKVLSDKDNLLITQPDTYIAEEVILQMRNRNITKE